jgi:PPK2 family polyphosphate:nucleotide phosphotransferase
MLDARAYLAAPGRPVDLRAFPTRYDGPLEKDAARAEFARLHARLVALEELLYAQHRHALLVVFQGMDTSGKDGVIRRVFSGLGPSGLSVASFKAPSTLERDHDFLWRVHALTPRIGCTTVFNRSHYEDVLIVRVNELVPRERWQRRYDHINAFERLLADEGVTIVKFFLHVSKDGQKRRLERRLQDADKHWKFNPDDLETRRRWKDYQRAYEEALTRCSAAHAPWYVVPAEPRWFRDLLVAQVLVEALEALKMTYPPPTFDPKQVRID